MSQWAIYRASGRQNTRGSTLIELVTAVAISSFLVVGIASAVLVSVQTLSTSQTSTATSIQTSQLLDRLVTELQSSLYVFERSATTLGFTIPDQNSDGYPERIRYAWTGTSGGALTRQYNGGTPQTLAASVDLFSLTPSYKSVPETYPSLGVEDATESLLIDHSGTTGTADNNVTLTSSVGQYFTYTLPAGSYAWRPTSVKFMAKNGFLSATSLVQMRPATASLTPSSTVLEQYSLASSSLASSYGWQQMSFSQIPPLASGGGVCLVLQDQLGLISLVAQSTSAATNLVQTSNAGASWSLDTSHSLVAQLYGKLTTSSGTKTVNSNYLTSLAVALRTASTSSTQQSTAPLLNHPEMLSGKWELFFDQDPTTVDINGDGLMDWVVSGGSTFNVATLLGNLWQSSGTQLNSNPGCDFAKTTILDVKMQNTSTGGTGATVSLNALRNGSQCVPIAANLVLQADGTQTLTLTKKTNDSTTATILSIGGLAAQPVLVHLIIDPSVPSLSISVNNVERGTFSLATYASSDATRCVALSASGSNAQFSYFRVRVLEQ